MAEHDLSMQHPSQDILEELEQYADELQRILQQLERLHDSLPVEELQSIENALQECKTFLRVSHQQIQAR